MQRPSDIWAKSNGLRRTAQPLLHLIGRKPPVRRKSCVIAHREIVLEELIVFFDCWYYRRKGNWAKAYQHSKRLLDEFDVYDNPGIYGNYISTILGMLDNEYNSRKTDSPIKYWTSETERTTDWNFCVSILREIIDNNLHSIGERVGIHYAKMGRLLTFTPQLETLPIEKISGIIDEANRYFEMAIMYEDQNSKNYNKRCMEYRQMQVRSHLLKMDIIERINIQRIENKLRNLALREEEIKEQLERQATKLLEIIAVFTAVITLIITAVGFANNFSFAEAVNLILITSCAWCFVYSIFVFMIHSSKRMFKSIIVAILMTCLIYLLISVY